MTIGGAVVLDAFPSFVEARCPCGFPEGADIGSREEALLARISRRGKDGLDPAAAVRETGLKLSVLQPIMAALAQKNQVVQAGDIRIATEVFKKSRESVLAMLETFHKANPLVAGISKEELRAKLGLNQNVMEAVLAQLGRDKKLEISAEQVRLTGRGVELKDDEAKAKEQIEKAFAAAGLKIPLMKEVLASLPVDKTRAQKLVTLLCGTACWSSWLTSWCFITARFSNYGRFLPDKRPRRPGLMLENSKISRASPASMPSRCSNILIANALRAGSATNALSFSVVASLQTRYRIPSTSQCEAPVVAGSRLLLVSLRSRPRISLPPIKLLTRLLQAARRHMGLATLVLPKLSLRSNGLKNSEHLRLRGSCTLSPGFLTPLCPFVSFVVKVLPQMATLLPMPVAKPFRGSGISSALLCKWRSARASLA